jgi:hypothetical protein
VDANSSHLPSSDGDRPIVTIDRGVPNRILQVEPNAIVRASAEARTPDSQGVPVTRSMVKRVWNAPASDGFAKGSDEDRFTYALVAEIPGIAVDKGVRGIRIADWDLAMTPYQKPRRTCAWLFGRGPPAF